MSSEAFTPEWLDREEPVRLPIEQIEFEESSFADQSKLNDGRCLARTLSQLEGYNTNSQARREHVTYGSERVLEDGKREDLIGCSSCGALCALMSNEHKILKPGTEDNPNVVISVAEAPQPNPWYIKANFSDCKIGELVLPQEVPGLTDPELAKGLKFGIDD